LLILSSVNGRDDLGKGRGQLHEIADQQAVMAPLTAFSRTIMTAEDLPQAMADAYAVFETGRPRPVHIEIPLDVLAGPGIAAVDTRGRRQRPIAEPAAIAAAARLIDEAKRLVVIAGGGSVDAGLALKAFVEKSGAVLIPTVAGRGTVPDDHPQSVGAPRGPRRNFCGGRPGDRGACAKRRIELDVGLLSGELIQNLICSTPARDYSRWAAGRRAALRCTAAIAKRPDLNPKGVQWCGRQPRKRACFAAKTRRHCGDAARRRRAWPPLATTQIAYTANCHFTCRRPRCWFHPIGFGTLGYALPAAMGAKIAKPDRAVVALAGDAGFLFTVQEMATAAELGLALPILLWNNDALGQIAGDMVGRGIPEIAVKPRNPDFQALARAFHCHAQRPESLAGIAHALKDAFKADRPTLIEVHQNAAFLA
jgi:5-guanidino-2-oxopentanoate decarboxylase